MADSSQHVMNSRIRNSFNHQIPRVDDVFMERPVAKGLILAGITLLAAFLRFYKLGSWSLWGDEAFSLGFQQDGFVESLSVVLIHWTTSFLSMSEWNARLVPALIGVLSIPIFYILLEKIFGSLVAAVGATLLAVSPWHIYWSQNVRFYSLLLLFYTCSLLVFYIGFERRRSLLILLSLFLIVLAARERLFALMLIPVVLVYLLLVKFVLSGSSPGFRLRTFFLILIPFSLVGILIAGPYLKNLAGWMAGFGRINTNPAWIAAGIVYYIGLPVICVGSFGALYLLIKRERAALLFSLAAILPVLAIMVISLFQYAANRYAFVALTSWIVLASLAVKELFFILRGSQRIFAVAILALLVGSSLSEDFLYFKYQNGNRENWKAALETIGKDLNAGDLIVASRTEVTGYYLPDANMINYDDFGPDDFEQYQRVWFLEDMNVEELYPQILQWIKGNAREVGNFDVHAYARNFKMRVYLYDPEDGP